MKKTLSLILFVLIFVPVFSQNSNIKSIHQQELEHYNSLRISGEDYYSINKPANVLKNEENRSCNLNKIVFGWHPYWSNGLETNYDWSLLSDLCYFSYEVNPADGNATTTHNWSTASVIDDALANGVRVSLCVTLFSNHATFLNNSSAKQTLIDNIINMLQSRGANGVNIDFEGVNSSLKSQYNDFLIDLSNQVHNQIPNSMVSVCTYAVDWGDLFNEEEIDQYIDYYTIMGYDYYYSGSSTAGPTSPLYTFNAFDYNLSKTVNHYISEGATPGKLILGLPYYGMEWNTTAQDIPSSTTSFVSSRTYKYIKNNTSGHYSNRQWDNTSICPYYTYYNSSPENWRQCFVDDEGSLAYKYDFVNMLNIAGIGIWALGYDDGYSELWDLIQEKFTDCYVFPCSGTVYDLGGQYKPYFNKSDYVFTIAPDNASQVSIEFPVFDIEAGNNGTCNFDYIEIFDGNSTSATSLGKFCNTTGNPGTITSSGEAITIHVYTDGATVKEGFQLDWTCLQDNILPQTQITTNSLWEKTDFDVSFNDADNQGVSQGFYQVLENNGQEWRSNQDSGFFNDNFNNQIHADWTQVTGTWSIENQSLVQSDETLSNNNIYANINQVAGGVYLYQWKMKIDGTGNNRRAGIYVMCSNPSSTQRGDAYMVYFRVDQNKCQIYKCDNDNIEIKTDDAVNVNANQWYDYKLIVNTNTGLILAYQDDVLVSEWEDPTPLTSGNSLSFRTGNCKAYYDDIQVYKNRTSTANIGVGDNKDVRYQNVNQNSPACKIKSIVIDDSKNLSSIAQADVNIDWTAPDAIIYVNDGDNNDVDTTNVGTELHANWANTNDANSFIEYYEYSIGTSPNAQDIVPWTQNGTSNYITHTNLNLNSGTQYFFNVRATNVVDLKSSVASSDGIRYVDALSDIDDVSNSFYVFPNPVNDKIFIKSEQLKIISADVLSTTGEVIISKKVENKDFNISLLNIKPAIYILRLETDKGVFFKKIVLKK